MSVKRYDSGEFSSPTRTPNGYLRCDAKITRVGVFNYKLADGSTRSELRVPDEVFNEDSIKSFQDVPLTNEHPREALTPKNTRRFQAGIIKDVRQHDSHIAARVLITDEDAINDAEAGKSQLSCGYTCDLDFSPGMTSGIPGVADGLRFDAIQKNIVGNHVAIVSKGRAGADSALHLDADDAVMVTEPISAVPKPAGPNPGPVGGTMKTIRIDNIDFEMSEQAAQMVGNLTARLDGMDEKIKAALASMSTEKARADKAEEDLTEAKKLHEDALSPDKVQAAVQARVALQTTAMEVLKDDSLDLNAMSEAEIKTAVVVKVSPGAKERLDGADEAYIGARFDAAVEQFKADAAKKPKPMHAVRGAAAPSPDMRFDSAAARTRMLEANYKMGRDVITPSNIPNQ